MSCVEIVLTIAIVVKLGRSAEAEVELEKLLGVSYVKSAMLELAKSDRGDDMELVKLSEFLYGRHFKGTCHGPPGYCSNFVSPKLRSFVFICWWDVTICLNSTPAAASCCYHCYIVVSAATRCCCYCCWVLFQWL